MLNTCDELLPMSGNSAAEISVDTVSNIDKVVIYSLFNESLVKLELNGLLIENQSV